MQKGNHHGKTQDGNEDVTAHQGSQTTPHSVREVMTCYPRVLDRILC